MRTKILLLLFLLFTIAAQAQVSKSFRFGRCGQGGLNCPKLSLFHETNTDFSKLWINTVNADYIILCRRLFMASIRGGISYYTFPKIRAAGIPVEFNFLVGKSSWLVEAGLGIQYLFFYRNYSAAAGTFSDDVSYLAATGRVGIRYERPRGFFFRIGYTPMYSLINHDKIEPLSNHKFIHMMGLGVGYTFDIY